MENIRKITVQIIPINEEKDEQELQVFDIDIKSETANGDQPLKKELIWLLEEAINTIENY